MIGPKKIIGGYSLVEMIIYVSILSVISTFLKKNIPKTTNI